VPYKERQDRLENQRFWHNYVVKLRLYRSMGLEPVDINDPRSALECQHCGKVTGRNSAHVYRHHRGCVKRLRTLRLAGYPREYWSRRKGAVNA
jgi:hypothetical protein